MSHYNVLEGWIDAYNAAICHTTAALVADDMTRFEALEQAEDEIYAYLYAEQTRLIEWGRPLVKLYPDLAVLFDNPASFDQLAVKLSWLEVSA